MREPIRRRGGLSKEERARRRSERSQRAAQTRARNRADRRREALAARLEALADELPRAQAEYEHAVDHPPHRGMEEKGARLRRLDAERKAIERELAVEGRVA